jgi:Tol biopolymer transport system component
MKTPFAHCRPAGRPVLCARRRTKRAQVFSPLNRRTLRLEPLEERHLLTALSGTLAYWDYLGDQKLWVKELPDGESVKVPTGDVRVSAHIFWSADGRWLTFSGGSVYNAQVYVVRPDGSGLQCLTANTILASMDLTGGNFSPDGTKIVLSQNYGGIYTIDVNTCEVTDLGIQGHFARWSHDGQTIAFSNWGFGTYNSDIFVYGLTTRQTVNITQGFRGADEGFNQSNWLPDGKRLVAAKRQANGVPELLSLDAYPDDGLTAPVLLTSGIVKSFTKLSCGEGVKLL